MGNAESSIINPQSSARGRDAAGTGTGEHPSPGFSYVLILKVVKVLCFLSNLHVLKLKGVRGRRFPVERECRGREEKRGEDANRAKLHRAD